MLKQIVKVLDDKKSMDICVLKIDRISTIADYFVICSGTSVTHTKAIADELEEKMSKSGLELLHKEGYDFGKWILMDYGSVIVHIFTKEERNFYDLERIWADAEKIGVDNLLQVNYNNT